MEENQRSPKRTQEGLKKEVIKNVLSICLYIYDLCHVI